MNRIRALLIGMAALAAGGTEVAAVDATTLYGEAQELGNGFAQLYVELDTEGAPAVIGVTFDQRMLEGLPTMPNTWSRCFDKNGNGRIDPHGECHGDYELEFGLPQELAGVTPFAWVSVNWNPMGHTPPAPPVWAVPHFDFHFYTMAREAVRQIRPGPCAEQIHCDDFVRAQMPVPARMCMQTTSTSARRVNDTGNHLIDSQTPELIVQGRAFTHTFIFGAYDGQITFYEPMITHAYLESRPDICVPIKQPAWAMEGYYPTAYCIRYLADDGRYTVSLEHFVRRTAG